MILFFDTETELISPGRTYPPMACLSFVLRTEKEDHTALVHWTQAGAFMQGMLSRPDVRFVGAYTAFDMGVCAANFPELLPFIFTAYLENRVEDVQVRQKIIDIASGCYRGTKLSDGRFKAYKYSLADLCARHTERPKLDKDTWRLRYGELRDSPVEVWPEGAREYAIGDATATRDVWDSQEVQGAGCMEDQHRAAYHSWALSLTSAWGLRTNGARVDALEVEALEAYTALEGELKGFGFIRENGVRDTKFAKAKMLEAWAAKGDPNGYIRTDPSKAHPEGDVSLAAEACERSGDPHLELYGSVGTLKTTLSKDIKALRSGTVYPIHTRFDFAASGRSTSSKPNVQNWGTDIGPRETFEPRPGWVYLNADASGLELCTLAETCLRVAGYTHLGDAILAGKDPHCIVAGQLLGIPYEDAVRRYKDPTDQEAYLARQSGKVANFGFPGGLGIKAFVAFAKSNYGVVVTEDRARFIKERWLSSFPEMGIFFAWINSLLTNHDGTGTIRQFYSNRYRGMCRYTQACNSYFQGLGADAMKHVATRLAEACYVTPSSPIYGGRPVNFIHDEFLVEYPEGSGMHDAAIELGRIMEAGAREVLPTYSPKCKPMIIRQWSKLAEPLLMDGRLVPWEPALAGMIRMGKAIHARYM